MRLTPADIRGVLSLPPAPCKPGGDAVDATDTVDTDALAWFLEKRFRSRLNCLDQQCVTKEAERD